MFKDYRMCPNCRERFTVDPPTKRLQLICIGIALIALALTMLLYFTGNHWIIPSIISYILLGTMIYIGNRRLRFIPYDGPE